MLSSRETYKFYSAIEPVSVFSVGWNSFTEIAIKCGLIGSGFGLSDLDLMWKNSLFYEVKNNPLIPGMSLIRFQFMEMIARMALDKYLRSKQVNTAVEALKRLLSDMAPLLETYDSNQWRWNVYICEEVDLVYKAWKVVLDTIYQRFSIRKSKPGLPKFMCLEEFTDLCTQAGLINENFVAREVGTSFSLSQTTEIDEVSSTKHLEMSFVEFLEALARACDKSDNTQNKPLAMKIADAMPLLLKLCPRQVQEPFQVPELYGK